MNHVLKAPMAWWEGVDETRILVAPDPSALGSVPGRALPLCHPKYGNTGCYLFINGTLQELHWFKQSFGSWFLGDYVSEDGCVYYATPVDPVFILLPIFEEARMKKEDDPGKFRQLDEIMFISGYPAYQLLLNVAEKVMPVVCEIREIGSSKFFRLDDSKVLAWLIYKVRQLKQVLPTLDKNFAAQDEKNTLMDAVSIVGEYLKEPLLKLLCNHLKLNLEEVTRKALDIQIISATPGTSLGTPHLLQENNGNDKKITRSGKQAKKVKMETDSQNIREMFRRASGRRG